MNPFVQVEFCQCVEQNSKVSVVISTLKCFEKARLLNEQCRNLKAKPAFYALNCSGLFGVGFVDLQKVSYTFSEKTADGESVTAERTVESLSLKDYIDRFELEKFDWGRRQGQKPSKMLFFAVI